MLPTIVTELTNGLSAFLSGLGPLLGILGL